MVVSFKNQNTAVLAEIYLVKNIIEQYGYFQCITSQKQHMDIQWSD